MPEVIGNLVYIVVPLPLPINPIQIILVDLGFELFIALSYAWEISESPQSLMTRLPRKPVSQKSIERIAALKQRQHKRDEYVLGFIGALCVAR